MGRETRSSQSKGKQERGRVSSCFGRGRVPLEGRESDAVVLDYRHDPTHLWQSKQAFETRFVLRTSAVWPSFEEAAVVSPLPLALLEDRSSALPLSSPSLSSAWSEPRRDEDEA